MQEIVIPEQSLCLGGFVKIKTGKPGFHTQNAIFKVKIAV
jgi:hypothetical protein